MQPREQEACQGISSVTSVLPCVSHNGCARLGERQEPTTPHCSLCYQVLLVVGGRALELDPLCSAQLLASLSSSVGLCLLWGHRDVTNTNGELHIPRCEIVLADARLGNCNQFLAFIAFSASLAVSMHHQGPIMQMCL